MQLQTPRVLALTLALLAALPLGLGLAQDRPAAAPQAAPEVAEAEPVEPVTVIAVRHAEKAKDDPLDPGLTEAGQARAQELARVLGAAGVTHLFTSPYRRTGATIAPLAEAAGLDVTPYDPRDPTALVSRLRSLPPGSRAVVSGHSNTTPGLVRALGGSIGQLETYQGVAMLGDDEYDRLFVLTLGDGERLTTTVELRYGARSRD